jgi:hypothetical protein
LINTRRFWWLTHRLSVAQCAVSLKGSPRNLALSCAVRMAIGSVAHQQRCCDCYGPGSTESDNPQEVVKLSV